MKAQLRSRYGNVPVPFLYFADWEWDRKLKKFTIDSNIPHRVKKSSLYQPPFFRTLLRQETDTISDKWKLAERIKALGMNFKGSPFPVTYFTIPEALAEVTDPVAQFFIKSIKDDYGSGVHVQSRETLNALWESHAAIQGVQVVIQEVMTDLSQIVGHQFDIKFYVLISSGRVYMHQNAEIVLSSRQVFNGTSMQKERHPESSLLDRECIHSFLSSRSTGKGKQWLEAIHAQLVATLPVMEPVIQATATENDGNAYHIFAGQAIIRENGEALIKSYVDWPIVDWTDTGFNDTTCDDSTSDLKSLEERKAGYEETLSTMFGDFFAISLGLANTTAFTDDSESRVLLDGRVREAIGFRIPSNVVQSR